jgi:NADPH:quinone reductase-like Zn-dependent oxidoreductase
VLNVRVRDSVFGRQKLQRVLQGRGGACAEWCVVEGLDVLSKPTNITHEQAAANPSAALVAVAALVNRRSEKAAPWFRYIGRMYMCSSEDTTVYGKTLNIE